MESLKAALLVVEVEEDVSDHETSLGLDFDDEG